MALTKVTYKDGSTVITAQNLNDIQDEIISQASSKAPVASPNFTGTPKAPTAAAGTNNTQIASTAFVKTAVDAKYTKPNAGIPKADLAAAVQTSLGKADTAIQAHQDISGKKNVQDAVSDPSASGESATFIATISQNAQGVITPTKKTVRGASASQSGLMSASDKAKLDGMATFYVRPNLLDNWYFDGDIFPINQRGSSQYVGTSAGAKIYDRWSARTAATLVNINAGALHVAKNTSSASTATEIVSQFMESPSALQGKTVTFSALAKGNVRLSISVSGSTAYSSSSADHSSYDVITVTGEIASDATSVSVNIQANNGAELWVKAAKLEIGDTQTLAHQENNEWVLNEIPNPAAEMAKCRRFYQRFTQTGASTGVVLANVIAWSATSANLTMHLGMRVPDGNNLTVEYSDISHIRLAATTINSGIPLTDIQNAKVTNAGDVVMTLTAEALTPGAVYNAALVTGNQAWIAFSAEP